MTITIAALVLMTLAVILLILSEWTGLHLRQDYQRLAKERDELRRRLEEYNDPRAEMTAAEIAAEHKRRHAPFALPRSWSDQREQLENSHRTAAQQHERLVNEIQSKQQTGEL